jgi:tetratricopeptide (TPR) repeat protein
MIENNNYFKKKSIMDKYTSFIRKNLLNICIPFITLFFNNVQVNATELEEYNQKYNTVAHYVLNLESKLGTIDSDYKVLDDIINISINRINTKEEYSKLDALNILKTIDSILDEKGFKNKSTLLLNEGLKKKELDCKNYSLIYLAIGEVLELPIYGVFVPEHMFIRWDKNGIHDPLNNNLLNEGDFNWETLDAKVITNNYYINHLDISLDTINNKVFLDNLKREQIISLAYTNIADYYRSEGFIDKANEYYDKSLEFDTNNYRAIFNKGDNLIHLKKYDEAINCFNQSLKLELDNPLIYYNRGLAYQLKGDIDSAIKDYNSAIDLFSFRKHDKKDLSKFYFHRGIIQVKNQDIKDAINDFSLAIKYNPNNINAYLYRGELYKIIGDDKKSQKDINKFKKINNNKLF